MTTTMDNRDSSCVWTKQDDGSPETHNGINTENMNFYFLLNMLIYERASLLDGRQIDRRLYSRFNNKSVRLIQSKCIEFVCPATATVCVEDRQTNSLLSEFNRVSVRLIQ